ncbi:MULTISPECIES: membrane-targeted effector domain-containing toxin [unclassified Pseudomonas]|uniref:membrane-targeted effector domain-containing toxin n=1 Tax=unclassified Pseudomonas TaxID=196821 RepID=UPI0030DC1597
MSTQTEPTLEQLETQLLEIDPTLRGQTLRPVQLPHTLQALEKVNATLKQANAAFFTQARALYKGLAEDDTSLARLKTNLDQQLQTLDETSRVEGQGRKAYMIYTAGSTALEQEASLNAKDYLLTPSDQRMVEDCSRGPAFRPGMYALTFTYQEQTVAFAGAFVLTRQASPVVNDLTCGEPVGPVLLFTPSRGLEPFDSLHDLDQGLLTIMATATDRDALTRHLPVAYQHVHSAGIWPLELQPITGQPLFEFSYQALLNKRSLDIEAALANQTPATRGPLLDAAIQAALPDLSERLEFRAQRLLEQALYNRLPAWYRNAAATDQHALIAKLANYNQARQSFLDLFGPAATPQALAHYQLVERLADDMDIHDLDPHQLHITTQRKVSLVGDYAQRHDLVALALAGLHTDDGLPGSDFLHRSQLTYADAPLQGDHAQLTPQALSLLLQHLHPRLDFAAEQKSMLGTPEIKQATRALLDQRLLTLATLARLQGHLDTADYRRFEQLRANLHPHLRAQPVLVHGAQLKDLWLLRDEAASGQVKRLLLCTPEAPRARQFMAFDSLRECQTHIIGWADEASGAMRDYVIQQVPVRFRPKMTTFMNNLSFKPGDDEYQEVTFGPACNHADCLDAMVAHWLESQALDDYQHSSPPWYRAASAANRIKLTSLAEDTQGAQRTYDARPDSEARLPTFEAYVHEHAKASLNRLLGRQQNDVDPDTVFVYSPKPLLGPKTEMPYTQLYRDGYEDGVGFLDEKFSASATFRGPAGVDLSRLTAQNVARSVTGVWIGQRYTERVRLQLQTESPGYDDRRNAILKINQLQMKSAALESRLQGHIASADLAWLERGIDGLGDKAVSQRNSYRVYRLFIDGEWAIGNYLLSHADNPTLLYTPNAPDGISFREARLFNYLLKQVDGMPAYFCGRVPTQSRSRVSGFLESVRKGLPSDINRTTPSPARYDAIAHAAPLADLRHEFYNMALQRKIDEVNATTVNRMQKITGILWTCVEWLTAVATIPFPPLSLSLGGLLAFKDAMLALNAYQQRDKALALQHFLGYLLNSGGALLFDYRQVLKGTFNLLSPLRPLIPASKQALKIAALKPLKSTVPPGLQPVLFDGQSLWAAQQSDALGRHLLYRLDARTGDYRSTARLVNQDASGNWTRSGLTGGGKTKYEKLAEGVDNPLAPYEIAPDQSKNFRAVLAPDFLKEQSDWGAGLADASRTQASAALAPLRETYPAQVLRLTEDANQFFQTPGPRPARTAAPALAPDASHAGILQTLFAPTKRLIIGAQHNAIASKQLLIEHMPALAKQGLKRLYLENLPADILRSKLQVLNKQAKGDIARALKQVEDHLAEVDSALGLHRDAPFTYRKLMLAAHRHTIAVEALDGSASYHLEHVLALGDGERFIPRASTLRNFYSHKILERDAADGWIALVEQNRLGTYDQIPGLADLQNALALRVEEVPPGGVNGIWPDVSGAAQSRGDYRLAMTTAPRVLPSPGSSRVVQAAAVSSHFDTFDLPATLHEDITQLASEHRGLDTRYASQHRSKTQQAAIQSFIDQREQLHRQASRFVADYTFTKRPSLTLLATATTEVAFLERLYQSRLGLVIGEVHSAVSPKQFLIKHMKWLKKQGVRTLYVEHLLTDLHQAQLDAFHSGLKMPERLQRYVKRQDLGHMWNYSGPHTYIGVLSAANKYGIRVRALDCTASYHTKGIGGANVRPTLFSYFANEVIKADQAAQGAHKWVALMGTAHTDTHYLVPGIAQLQNAVSLHIHDVAPSLAKPLHVGAWETADDAGGIALRSDFKLTVGVPGRALPAPVALPDRSKLKQAGEFLIERRSSTEINLVHRSRNDEIVTTAIQIDERGRYFINRWDRLNEQRFLHLSQLIEALKSHPPLGIGPGLRPVT